MGTVHSRKNRNSSNGSSSSHTPPPFKMSYPPNQTTQSPSNQNQTIATTSQENNNMSSLPYSHVDCSLRALAGQAQGFGRCAIGGLNGLIYHVTNLHGFFPFSLPLCKKF